MKISKKIQRVLGTITLILLLTSVGIASFFSEKHWENEGLESVNINIEHPDNQELVSEQEVQKVISAFFEAEEDSNALSVNAFLLETDLEALPYVADAQVYWNMQQTLEVQITAKQAKAQWIGPAGTALLTKENEVLSKPKRTSLDLPVITGAADSAAAAAAGIWLERVAMGPAFEMSSVAQLDMREDALAIVPKGFNHVVLANKDERLEEDMKKLAAYYGTMSEEDLAELKRIDLRYKNQVVTTTR